MTKVTYTPTISSVQGFYGEHAVTKVTYTLPMQVLQELNGVHAVTKVTCTFTIASVAKVIRGACCDQGNVHTYHCQYYKG